MDKNFWVVSPNVTKNDSELPQWLAAIENKKIVFMGWDIDNSKGRMFQDTIVVGDIVLIARRANFQKELYLCGEIASDTQYGQIPNTPNEAFYRQLDYTLDSKVLDSLNLNFAGSAYKDSHQIPAIYQLKPFSNPVDKIIADTLLERINQQKKLKEMQNKLDLLKTKNQIILQGPPGTGKTRLAEELAYSVITGNLLSDNESERQDQIKALNKDDQYKFIQFHPAYTYEDFVRGIMAKTETIDGKTGITYSTENKILCEIAKKANDEYQKKTQKDKAKKYVLVIDEINRANLPSVLGELIYALEYRGREVNTMYKHKDFGNKITLPENLYIIGTMNTADRSVGQIDYALRRRFAFVSLSPDRGVVENYIHYQSNNDLKAAALEAFDSIEKLVRDNISPEFNDNIEDIMIGHSYFLAENKDKLAMKINFEVAPILAEYVKDGIILTEPNEFGDSESPIAPVLTQIKNLKTWR